MSKKQSIGLLMGLSIVALGWYFGSRIFFSNRMPDYRLIVEFQHLKQADSLLRINDPRLGSTIQDQVKSLNLNAMARGGGGGIELTKRDGLPTVRVLLLAQQPVLQNADLPIPSSGDILYLFRNQQWEAHPTLVSDKAKETIQIRTLPSPKGTFKVSISGVKLSGSAAEFTFTPPWDEQQLP